LAAAAKFLVAATKHLFVVPNFVAETTIFSRGGIYNSPTFNSPPPSDAARKQKKKYCRGSFSVQYCHNSKTITPLET